MKCAGAIQFMWNRGGKKVIDACLQHRSVRHHQVAGKSWESMCNAWRENFVSMCVFSPGDIAGVAHNELQWDTLLWTHLWIHHMHFFAKKWRILSKFSCFALEGGHRRMKRILRNSGGLSLLRGRLGVQVVVDNHPLDDNLAAHGWDAAKRAQYGQRPISVQRYISRTRRQLLTNVQNHQILDRRFRCRKRQM